MKYAITVTYASGIGSEELIFDRLDWAVDVAKTITDRGDRAVIHSV